MMNFISENLGVCLLIGIPSLLVVGSGAVYFIRRRGLDRIRQDVYALFLEAERLFTESGTGQEKFSYVVEKARELLPKYIQVLVTSEGLERIIQLWFDEIKDFLDDGKLNDSNKGGLE